MADNNVGIILTAVDNASASINKVTGEIGKLDAKTQSMQQQMASRVSLITQKYKEQEEAAKKSTKSQAFSWTELNSAISVVSQGVQKLKQVYDFSKEGASLDRLGQASGLVFKQMGGDINEAVAAIEKASLGTVSSYDAMAAASRAAMLNVTTDADELGQLMEIAAFRGRAMGISSTQAFNDMVTGIGRASPLILDNLGIITKGWAEEASAAGEAYDAQFILNKVMEQGGQQLKEVGGLAEDTAASFEQFETQAKNAFDTLKVEAGQSLAPFVGKLAEAWEEANNFNKTLKELDPELYKHYKNTGNATKAMKELVAAHTDHVDAFSNTKQAMQDNIVTLEEYADNIEETTKVNEEYLKSLGSMSKAIDDHQDKMLELDETYAEEVANLEELTATRGWDIAAIDEQQQKIDEIKEKMAEESEAFVENTNIRKLAMLEEQLAFGGLSEEETRYLEELGIAWGVYTTEAVTQMQNERAEIAQLVEDFDNIPTEKTVTINVQQIGGYDIGTAEYNRVAYAGRDSGGPGEAGVPYMIGTGAQPEMFTPSQSGNFTPNADRLFEFDYNKLGRVIALAIQREQ